MRSLVIAAEMRAFMVKILVPFAQVVKN